MDYIVGFFTGILAWPALELIALALALIAGIFFIGNKHSDWNITGFVAMGGIGYLVYNYYHPDSFSVYDLGIFIAKYIGVGVVYALINVFYQMYRKKQVISREKDEIAQNYYNIVAKYTQNSAQNMSFLGETDTDRAASVNKIVQFLKTGEPDYSAMDKFLEEKADTLIKNRRGPAKVENEEDRKQITQQAQSYAMKAVVYSVIQHFNDVSYKHASFIEVAPAAHVPKWDQGNTSNYFSRFATYKPLDNSWVTVSVQKQKLYLNIVGSIVIYPILFIRQVVGDYLKMIADFLTDLIYNTVVKTAKSWFANIVKI